MKIPLLLQNNFKAEYIKIFEERERIISLHQDARYESQMDGPRHSSYTASLTSNWEMGRGLGPTPLSSEETSDPCTKCCSPEGRGRTGIAWANLHSLPSPTHVHTHLHTSTPTSMCARTGPSLSAVTSLNQGGSLEGYLISAVQRRK